MTNLEILLLISLIITIVADSVYEIDRKKRFNQIAKIAEDAIFREQKLREKVKNYKKDLYFHLSNDMYERVMISPGTIREFIQKTLDKVIDIDE